MRRANTAKDKPETTITRFFIAGVAALFLATGTIAEAAQEIYHHPAPRHLVSDCRYSDDTFVEDCWSPNYHRCDVIRFEHNEITGHFELADLLEQKRHGILSKNARKFIPLLRKCEAFYECVAKRGFKWPNSKWVDHAPAPGAPKHCYWPTRDLGPSP